jgi:hypothetical protein
LIDSEENQWTAITGELGDTSLPQLAAKLGSDTNTINKLLQDARENRVAVERPPVLPLRTFTTLGHNAKSCR